LRTYQALDCREINHSQKGPLIKALVKLSKKSALHPDCLVLSDVATRDNHPVARGTFGDVWRGQISGREVAIKVLRVYQRADVQKLLKVGFCFA
jgi:predicted unusual protein kinase regulating ubiquinone biosynthesis (AarF/ABC1/UbiB family)